LLPKNLPNPPTYRKTNPSERPILIYAVSSDAIPSYKLDQYANVILGQSLSTVSGVGQVLIAGEQLPTVTVQVNPEALAAHGLSLTQVQSALTSETLDQPKGNLEGPHQQVTLNSNDQLFDPGQFRKVIVAYRNGAPITVGDIGDVINSSTNPTNPRTRAWFDGKPPQLEKSIPPSVHVDLVSDRSPYHSRFRCRREVDVDFDDVSRRLDHLCVLAQTMGDNHSKRDDTAVDRRHFRRDVFVRL
jgi:AcrB/AcrD/AcrF family